MGVPPRLHKYCFGGPLSPLQVRIKSLEEISPSDLRLLASLGFHQLWITADGVFDLRSITELLTDFTSIMLAAHAPPNPIQSSYIGAEVFGDAIELVELESHAEVVGVADLRYLPNLHRVLCSGSFALSAAENPNVVELRVDVEWLDPSFQITAPLQRLVINSGKSMATLPKLGSPSSMTSLIVSGARKFDAACLEQLSNLESLNFDLCEEIINIETLLELQSLRSVEFYGVKEMPHHDVLVDLLATHFEVDINRVFDTEFQARVQGRSGWTFTPFKPSRSKATTGGAVPVFVDGIDALSFAPFEAAELEGGTFQIRFDDWPLLAVVLNEDVDDLSEDVIEDIVFAILKADLPEVLSSGRVSSDSEADSMRLDIHDLKTLSRVGMTLLKAWGDTNRLRQLNAARLP
jgi:hypothetical protein